MEKLKFDTNLVSVEQNSPELFEDLVFPSMKKPKGTFLEQKVFPQLLPALDALVRCHEEKGKEIDPLVWLGQVLMRNKDKIQNVKKKNSKCELCSYSFVCDKEGSKRKYDFKLPKRYSPSRLIGEGAYGVVIAAYDSVLGREVAIKSIPNIWSRNEEFQKRILREILLMEHLRFHENIVELIDLIPSVDLDSFKDAIFVMDLMDSDMAQLLRNNAKLTEKQISYIIFEILKGLSYIHSASILHRDIKPGNILLSKSGDVKICDFGLSRGVDFDIKMSTHYVVTRWYRAPELLMMWDRTSTSIDIWSVGCILAEMLAGSTDPRFRVLFKGNGWVDQLERIVCVRGLPPEESLRGSTSSKEYLKSLRKYKYRKVPLDFKFPEASKDAISLLDSLLEFDAMKRPTASEALKHRFFLSLREKEEEEMLSMKCKRFDFRVSESFEETHKIKKKLWKVFCEWNERQNGIDVNGGAVTEAKGQELKVIKFKSRNINNKSKSKK